MTTPHADRAATEPTTHPWASAWTALSPERRAALRGWIADREPVAALAARLGRTEEDTEALVGSTLLAFRREVVLTVGTGHDEACTSLVLRLVDGAGDRLTRADRRALAAHADTCPACSRAVGELLEIDARLREGLLRLLGADAPADSPADSPADPVGPVAAPAPRTAPVATDDAWAPAFERLTDERRTALVHGAVGAEPATELAARLGTTEPAARELAASSLVAFRQAVLSSLPVGTGAGCGLVAEHRADDIALGAARVRALEAHAAACTDCAPTVAEILALHESLRPRVAGLALGAEAATWLKDRPRRSWVPGVERPTEPLDRRRRIGIGAGLAAAAVTAVALLGAGRADDAPRVLPASDSQPGDAATGGTSGETGTGADARVVVAGARLVSRTPVAADAAATPPPSSADGPRPSGGAVTVVVVGEPPSGPDGDQDGPGEGPDGPGEDPETPSLDVTVDSETGSVTVTVGLLGDPIVISTPPLPGQDGGRRRG